MLLAGDVIFTEVRDLLAAATNAGAIASATSSGVAHDQRAAAIRRNRSRWPAAPLALWIVIALLLSPTEAKPAVKDPAEWRNELKETLTKPIPTSVHARRTAGASGSRRTVRHLLEPSVSVARCQRGIGDLRRPVGAVRSRALCKARWRASARC